MPHINNCHLTAIGDFVIEKLKLDEKQSNITFKGWMAYEKIIPYLYFCDAVIVPSRWEGFAMVPLEAMSFSKPVLAANTTSLPEVVEDKKTGYLFSLDDSSNLIQLLNNLEKNHLKELGMNSFLNYKNSFTSQKMLHQVAILYENLMENRNE